MNSADYNIVDSLTSDEILDYIIKYIMLKDLEKRAEVVCRYDHIILEILNKYKNLQINADVSYFKFTYIAVILSDLGIISNDPRDIMSNIAGYPQLRHMDYIDIYVNPHTDKLVMNINTLDKLIEFKKSIRKSYGHRFDHLLRNIFICHEYEMKTHKFYI